MNAERSIGWARSIGFVLGIGIAASSILGWRVPRGTGRLGADVAVAFLQTGELELSSTEPIVMANDLYPGDAANGSVDVRNSSASKLSVGVAAEPSTADLDEALWIDVRASGTQLYRGPLGELRDGSTRFTITSQQTRTLAVRAWLPGGLSSGYEGRVDQINLTFDPSVVAAR